MKNFSKDIYRDSKQNQGFLSRVRMMNEDSIQLITTVFIMLFLMLVIYILTPRFMSVTNISNVLQQVSLVMITGSAVTLLMISGNLDLSVGGVLGQAAVMYAFLTRAGLPLGFAILVATLSGAAMGLLNGVLVTKLRITPVITTLGTMSITRGIAHIFADGTMITAGLPRNFKFLSTTYFGPVSLVLVIVLVVVVLFYFVQTKTTLGRYAFYIGSNQETAFFSGLKVDRVVTWLYILSGTLAAFSGVLLASRLGAGDSKMGAGFEFDIILAALIGGTSIAGGKGSIPGMVIGAFIVGILRNALNLLNVQSYYQMVIMGLVLVLAILLQRLISEKISGQSQGLK
jgi:ribose/xylose/arabinose/galactoside ABC-type transport system permease subunit